MANCVNKNCLKVYRNGQARLCCDGRCNLCNFLDIDNNNSRIPTRIVFCSNEFCNEKFDLINDINNTTKFHNVSHWFNDTNQFYFACESCWCRAKKMATTNETGSKVYKLVPPERVQINCELQISSICLRSQTISFKSLSRKKRTDVCRNCDEILTSNLKSLKNLQEVIQDVHCEKCKSRDKVFFKQSDDKKFFCSECCEMFNLETVLDRDKDEKLRNIFVNIDYAESKEDLERNLKECDKVFQNDRFKNAFVYVIKEETVNVSEGIEQYSFEEYKKDFIYAGKSQLHISSWSSSYLRHFNLKSTFYENKSKKSIIKRILNNSSKIGVFRPFVCSSNNFMFFYESMMIGFTLNPDNENDLKNFSNQIPGKSVLLFKEERIVKQLQDHIFEQSYLQYKKLKLENKVLIVDLNNIDDLHTIYPNYKDSF